MLLEVLLDVCLVLLGLLLVCFTCSLEVLEPGTRLMALGYEARR